MRTGRQVHTDLGALLDFVGDERVVLEVGGPVLGAAHRREMHALAVHRVFQRMLVLEAAHHTEVSAEELRR